MGCAARVAPTIFGIFPATWWWFLVPIAAAIAYYFILTRALEMFAYSTPAKEDDNSREGLEGKGRRGGWVPYVATPHKAVRRMLEAAELKAGETLMDLGAGDGRYLVCASRHFNARAIGFEAAEAVYYMAKVKLWWAGEPNVKVLCRNFWDCDLSEADVVVLFLFPQILSRLQFKLRTELKPGARVVTFNWEIKGWQPWKKEMVVASFRSDARSSALSPIFVYKSPFKRQS